VELNPQLQELSAELEILLEELPVELTVLYREVFQLLELNNQADGALE
jgi:hypothetical protein